MLCCVVLFCVCGKTYLHKDLVHFRVTKYSDISGKIIPFFCEARSAKQKYSVLGVKALDFKDFCCEAAADMMKNKKHLTQEGLDVIHKIKTGMNRGREV